MEPTWPLAALSDLGRIVTGRTPPSTNPNYFGKECPFITPSDMDGSKHITSTERHLSESGASLLKRSLVPPGSVVVSCIGWQLGKAALTTRPAITNQQLNTIVPADGIDGNFLYYHLCTRREELRRLGSVGTRTPIVNKSVFGSLTLPLPPLTVQRRIAGLLSAYDDLIENSQRRIVLLAHMARAVYREWFVHFRFPGCLPQGSISLEELPQGWRMGRLDDVIVLQRGFDLPKADRLEGIVPIYAATGITGFHNEVKVKAPGVVTGRSGTIGEVLYVQEDFWPLNTALWAKAFPEAEPLYAYYVLSSIDLKQFNSGAAVPTLNRNDIHGLACLIPPRPLQRQFQAVAGAMLAQARALDLQIQNLRRTRDLLLPRLLAGELDVSSLSETLE